MNKNLKVILATLVTVCVVGTLAFSDINGSYAIDSSYLEQYLCPAVDNIIHYDTNGGNKIDDTKVPVNYRLKHITDAGLPKPTKKDLLFIYFHLYSICVKHKSYAFDIYIPQKLVIT